MVAILAIEIDSEGGIKTTKTVTQCVGEGKFVPQGENVRVFHGIV